uniref:Uncharacterized protein n=1 Tax=Setaria viridis TaxID=4556 RepID=A0A4U6UJV8_SETVI|nr:hypothetical protein SEVIR_5G303801v2 [Setaria viridis]
MQLPTRPTNTSSFDFSLLQSSPNKNQTGEPRNEQRYAPRGPSARVGVRRRPQPGGPGGQVPHARRAGRGRRGGQRRVRQGAAQAHQPLQGRRRPRVQGPGRQGGGRRLRQGQEQVQARRGEDVLPRGRGRRRCVRRGRVNAAAFPGRGAVAGSDFYQEINVCMDCISNIQTSMFLNVKISSRTPFCCGLFGGCATSGLLPALVSSGATAGATKPATARRQRS